MPTSLLGLTKGRIKKFLLSTGSDDSRTKIKKELLRWHPDKFEIFVLPLIYEDDINLVKEGLHIVSTALTMLLKETNN